MVALECLAGMLTADAPSRPRDHDAGHLVGGDRTYPTLSRGYVAGKTRGRGRKELEGAGEEEEGRVTAFTHIFYDSYSTTIETCKLARPLGQIGVVEKSFVGVVENISSRRLSNAC